MFRAIYREFNKITIHKMVFRVRPAFSQHICRKVEGITFCLTADNNVQSSRHHKVKVKALSSPYLPIKFYQSARCYSTKDKGIMFFSTTNNNVQSARYPNTKYRNLNPARPKPVNRASQITLFTDYIISLTERNSGTTQKLPILS